MIPKNIFIFKISCKLRFLPENTISVFLHQNLTFNSMRYNAYIYACFAINVKYIVSINTINIFKYISPLFLIVLFQWLLKIITTKKYFSSFSTNFTFNAMCYLTFLCNYVQNLLAISE